MSNLIIKLDGKEYERVRKGDGVGTSFGTWFVLFNGKRGRVLNYTIRLKLYKKSIEI